jgi:hypothetical protein
MSLAGNWNGKGKKRTALCWRTITALLRSCALENVRQSLTNVSTRGHLTRQARGQLNLATSSLQVEVGDQPTALIRVLGFLGFPSVYK